MNYISGYMIFCRKQNYNCLFRENELFFTIINFRWLILSSTLWFVLAKRTVIGSVGKIEYLIGKYFSSRELNIGSEEKLKKMILAKWFCLIISLQIRTGIILIFPSWEIQILLNGSDLHRFLIPEFQCLIKSRQKN